MYTKAFRVISALLQRKLRVIFAVILIVGILAGVRLSYAADDSILTLASVSGNTGLTFWGIAAVLLLPLLISLCAFHFNIPILILPIAFLKSAAFGFCSCCVIFAYGDAGWLVRFLVLFSDSAMFVVLCWYWFSHLEGVRTRLRQDTVLCFVLAVVIGMFDYIYISPFLAMLL